MHARSDRQHSTSHLRVLSFCPVSLRKLSGHCHHKLSILKGQDSRLAQIHPIVSPFIPSRLCIIIPQQRVIGDGLCNPRSDQDTQTSFECCMVLYYPMVSLDGSSRAIFITSSPFWVTNLKLSTAPSDRLAFYLIILNRLLPASTVAYKTVSISIQLSSRHTYKCSS